MLLRCPLLVLGLAFFAIINTLSAEPVHAWYDAEALHVHLMSGDTWHISTGHVFLFASLILLLIEILRATHACRAALTNHVLSVIVMVYALVLFLTSPGYGNSVFFMFVAMTAMDVMAGIVISVSAARRDVTLAQIAPPR